MRRKRLPSPYIQVAYRAMGDALYRRLIDQSWDELTEIYNRPEVQEAEAVIMRAIAEHFAPGRARRNHRPRKRR